MYLQALRSNQMNFESCAFPENVLNFFFIKIEIKVKFKRKRINTEREMKWEFNAIIRLQSWELVFLPMHECVTVVEG